MPFFSSRAHAIACWLMLLTTELTAPTVLVITSQHRSHRKHSVSNSNSTVLYLAVAQKLSLFTESLLSKSLHATTLIQNLEIQILQLLLIPSLQFPNFGMHALLQGVKVNLFLVILCGDLKECINCR
jgi:hypothetical protein